MSAAAAAVGAALDKIEHFVVLMLENRSFDHLFGALKTLNPAVDGVLDGEFSNHTDPAEAASPLVATAPVTGFAMPFDPGHEFQDIQIQLFGRAASAHRAPAARVDPAPMSGFVYSAEQNTADHPANAAMVMQCFSIEKLPVMSALAGEYAIFNHWHAPLPGPTWPNRFFVHAATSGGLTDSPNDADILKGFSFPAGTIYQRLEAAGLSWRIYHDGLPQSAGIDSLRSEFLDIFTEHFREMSFFEADLEAGTLPPYVFIEPKYDTGNNFVNGNSMHPLNDVREGERLVKRVYEALRASKFWASTALIVTFDEHGGFFDHVAPPPAAPPGGDARYTNPANQFDFDRLGVRVPAIVASPYTPKNFVIGRSPEDACDHTSVLATVEKRFALAALSQRDAAARTLESALALGAPRLSPDEARLRLPDPLADSFLARFFAFLRGRAAPSTAPMSTSQRVQLTLAHACNLEILDTDSRPDARRRYLSIRKQQDAADYIQDVETRIRARRRK